MRRKMTAYKRDLLRWLLKGDARVETREDRMSLVWDDGRRMRLRWDEVASLERACIIDPNTGRILRGAEAVVRRILNDDLETVS